MTPKEKAKELRDKYFNVGDQEFDYSKEFSLIAVDEILNSWYPVNIHCGYEFNHDNLTTSFYEYWEQVKNEIEKL